MINSPKYPLIALKSSFLSSIRQDYIASSPTEQKNAVYTLKWRYVKDSEYYEGDDGGSVDFVQWSGSPPPDPTEWDKITYTYDPAGRRIKKKVVGSYSLII